MAGGAERGGGGKLLHRWRPVSRLLKENFTSTWTVPLPASTPSPPSPWRRASLAGQDSCSVFPKLCPLLSSEPFGSLKVVMVFGAPLIPHQGLAGCSAVQTQKGTEGQLDGHHTQGRSLSCSHPCESAASKIPPVLPSPSPRGCSVPCPPHLRIPADDFVLCALFPGLFNN